MNKLNLLLAGITLGFVALHLPAAEAASRAAQAHAKPAVIGLIPARRIALRAFPGVILKEELEREPGGSGLRYSFDIRRGKLIHEVGVDAKSGKILENSDDSAASD